MQGRNLAMKEEKPMRFERRYVYLDGGNLGPGMWAESIGEGLSSVVHHVSIRALSKNGLLLDLRPGPAPAREDELNRINTLLNGANRAIALSVDGSESLRAELLRRRAEYKAAREKLEASF